MSHRGETTLGLMAMTTTLTAVLLLPVALASGDTLLPGTAAGWGVLLGVALVSHAAGQGLIAYALAHLKAGYETGRWSIHGWLRNALDKQYAVRGFYFGNDPRIGWADQLYTQRGDPRQAGITASLNF